MNFKITDKAFKLNNKDFFVYCGEIHYFRLPKRDWEKHIIKAKEANLNCIASYIPWSWHEYKEGKFDFKGKTNASRDLYSFLKLIKEHNLYFIARPGPYILGEFTDQGVPGWLVDKYPEVIQRDSKDKPISSKVASLMHPVFLKYAEKWYDKVMPIIREGQITKGGSIIMVQACNEAGVGIWIGGEGDYNPVALDYFHQHLKEEYKDIKRLNSIYVSKYDNFSQVEPPRLPAQSRQDLIRYYDWHKFHRRYYYFYIKFLYQLMCKRKITVPVFHNIPGWIFGKANDYPVCATMYSEVAKLYPKVFLGVDHIPENPSFRNFHDDLIANQISRAIQGGKAPLMVVELQAGTREHCVRTYANELDLFYKACLADGITGMNFYMFSQGINPKRRGSIGPVFYWQTPLNAKAEEDPLYYKIKDLGQFIKENAEKLINTEIKSEVAVGFYQPYYQTEFLIPALGPSKMDLKSFSLKYEPKFLRDKILFDGILKILRILGFTHNILDLQLAKIEEMLKFKQLWVASCDFMDKDTQKKLVDFVKSGGSLVIMPTLPDKDLYFLDNKYMYEEFKIKKKKTVYPGCPKIDILKVKDLHCVYPINLYEPGNAKIIAKTPEGKTCGLRKKIGKGFVNLIGSSFNYESRENLEAYEELLKLDSVNREVICDNPDLTVVKRDGKGYCYLFVLNFHPVEKIGRVFFKNPRTKKRQVFPAKGNLCVHAHSAIVLYVKF